MNLEHARSLFAEALDHHETGDFAQAEELLRRALALAPGRVSILCNLAGALLAQGRHEEALPYASRACELEPDTALAWDHAASCHEALAQNAAALPCLERALDLAPAAALLRRRAHVLMAVDRRDEARTVLEGLCASGQGEAGDFSTLAAMAFDHEEDLHALACADQALALDAQLAGAHVVRADTLLRQGRPAEALEAAGHAVEAGPLMWQAWSSLADARFALKDSGGALEAYDQALEFAGDAPLAQRTRWNRALALLQSGEFERGWKAFECRHEAAAPGLPLQSFPASPRWLGNEDVAGRSVLLVSEMEVGDTLQFCRYVAPLAALGAKVLLWVEPSLCRLLRGLPGVAGVFPKTGPAPAHDFHVPMMSLALAFGTRPETIPQPAALQVERHDAMYWELMLDVLGRPRVGVVWADNYGAAEDPLDALPLHLLAGLFGVRADFVSLQREVRIEERNDLATMPLLDMSGRLQDLADVAALVSGLDLVIAVDGAVAHLAASLGKPVWLLLPHAADWRWLRLREDSPWYPQMRLYRQPLVGDWAGVLESVRQDLLDLVHRLDD